MDNDNFPLHHVARLGRADSLKSLLCTIQDVNTKDKDGKTPLHCAAEQGNTNCLTLLLEKEACNINAQDKLGQ
jgi:ankyrin repeat protein